MKPGPLEIGIIVLVILMSSVSAACPKLALQWAKEFARSKPPLWVRTRMRRKKRRRPLPVAKTAAVPRKSAEH